MNKIYEKQGMSAFDAFLALEDIEDEEVLTEAKSYNLRDKEDMADAEQFREDDQKTENVTLEVMSNRLTDFSYTAKYIKLLNAVMVRIYGVVNFDMNTTDEYDIITISSTSRRPNYRSALAVAGAKKVHAAARPSGTISVRAMEPGVKSYGLYISGFWFV